jgi:hypothetical protein
VGQLLAQRHYEQTPVTEEALRAQLRRVRTLARLAAHEDDRQVLDAYSLSQQWLLLLQPRLQERRARNRKRLVTLDDLLAVQPAVAFTTQELTRFEAGLQLVENRPLDIAACILGVAVSKE